MFEREKLSGNNFNDWFRQLKLVLRVEKKMFVIEQPLPSAHTVDSKALILAQWNAFYDAYNEELNFMFEKQAGVKWFDLIRTFHACKQAEGKPVGPYILKMKGYLEQLEHLGYVLPQDISVGLILNCLNSDFVGFVRSYNMYNMGKTVESRKPIQNRKLLKTRVKEKARERIKESLAKDDACHHCKEVRHWKRNFCVYLAKLIVKKKQVGTASSSVSKNDVICFNVISINGVYEVDMINLVPHFNSICTVSNKRAKHNLDSTYLWSCRLAHISKKHIEKLQHDGLLKSTDEESFDKYVSCLSSKMMTKPFSHRTERATDLLGIIHIDVCGPFRHVSRQGASYFITFTDDYSHYGYIYLLKHKHEVFEMFKVFKNEVENQLGKTIKAL
nr:retrotransposon protein, putative, Ty1-copia subclass [Tanacetum cinerariifolium]